MIRGGFRDGEKAVTVTRGQCREAEALRSNHEEADTRMILHANHAVRADRRLVIQSPDTDVLVLSVSHFRSLDCPELWFHTGMKDRHRLIPVHDIAHALGEKMCTRTKIYSQTQQESSLILARKPFSRREWNGTKRDTKFVSLCNENETFVLLLSEREFG